MYLLTLVMACSDYKITQKNDAFLGDTALHQSPIISVFPDEVTLPASCDAQTQIVTVQNIGDAALEILGVRLTSNDWRITAPPFPILLSQNETSDWLLEGNGSGLLMIDSTDPVEPLVEVPLNSEINQAPDILITSPYNGFVIPVTGTTITAQINDDFDNVDVIPLVWTSNIDGYLGTSFSTPSGQATLPWHSGHTEGPHTITVTAKDSCEMESQDTLQVCQQYGYEVESLDISTWHFEGVASWDTTNNWLELTPVVENAVGSAFSTAIPVSGDNVEIDFSFYIGDGTGADGISLTALDMTRMSTFLGGTGCGIGYGGDASCTAGPALPGWSIEVDTYFNSGQDPTAEDHVMFTFDGDVDDPAIWAPLPEMEDNGWHTMRVVVNAPRVTVSIDGIDYINAELNGHFAFPSYVGFTAGTGGATNRHLIDSLTVTETVCPVAE